MRKLFAAIAIAFVALTTTAVVAPKEVSGAYEPLTDERKADMLKRAKKYEKIERTDIFALEHYSQMYGGDEEIFIEQSAKIVKGLKTDEEKVNAIFDWVIENMYYDYTVPSEYNSIDDFMGGTCLMYSFVTRQLIQAAGIPCKTVSGTSYYEDGTPGSHVWNRAFVNGKFIHIDSTWYEFDLPIEEWSISHVIDHYTFEDEENDVWDGGLYIFDPTYMDMIKEVRGLEYGQLLNSTFGYNIKDLYMDKRCTIPYELNKYNFVYETARIYYKKSATPATTKYTVSFNTNGGSTVASSKVKEKSVVAKPANPTKSGYKFTGWYKDAKLTTKWDFAKDKVTKNTTIYAGWVKTYKVSFNSNKGTVLKTQTIVKNKLVTEPTKPTRAGYKFTGWYKDATLKIKWNFKTDKVTGNVTVYAGWVRTK